MYWFNTDQFAKEPTQLKEMWDCTLKNFEIITERCKTFTAYKESKYNYTWSRGLKKENVP